MLIYKECTVYIKRNVTIKPCFISDGKYDKKSNTKIYI